MNNTKAFLVTICTPPLQMNPETLFATDRENALLQPDWHLSFLRYLKRKG